MQRSFYWFIIPSASFLFFYLILHNGRVADQHPKLTNEEYKDKAKYKATLEATKPPGDLHIYETMQRRQQRLSNWCQKHPQVDQQPRM